jgi:cell wall-associated NlpC family hydrolase
MMRSVPLALLACLSASAEYCTINRPVANMYSGATVDHDVVSQALYSTSVAIVREDAGWLDVQTPDAYNGWIPSTACHGRSANPSYGTGDRVAEVASLFAHIYREPDVTKHAPILTVPFESKLEVVAEPDDNDRRWVHVRLVDDRSGWVQRGDLQFGPRALTIPETISLAHRFLGLPYTWGGTSAFGYDCSGFTQMLCRRRGIHMPRDAQPQADWSGVAPVDEIAQLEPGDLLFFGPSSATITHTGMYIGDMQFIHASTSARPLVQVSRLDDEWQKKLVAMRRPK